MAWVNGRPRLETTLDRMERVWMGRYSVRQPVESSGATSAARASGARRGSESRMGKRLSVFAIYSPSWTKLYLHWFRVKRDILGSHRLRLAGFEWPQAASDKLKP